MRRLDDNGNPILYPFRPVYGTEQQIVNLTSNDIHDGYIYVSSDTGKIFLGDNSALKLIGSGGSGGGSGSTGFYWASADEEAGTLVKATEDADDGDPVFYFNLSALEGGSTIPDNDALILNSDGRFFRITDNTLSPERFFTVELIAVSGGGSGGGGGGGAATNSLTLEWDNIDYLGATYIYGQDVPITFYPHSDNADAISIQVVAHDKTGQYPDVIRSGRVLNGMSFNEFNANLLPPSNNIEIQVTIVDGVYNSQKGKKYTFGPPVKVLKMYLEKPMNSGVMTIKQGQASLPYYPHFTGLGTTENPVQIYYSVDGGEAQLYNSIQGADGNQVMINIPAQEHGMHSVDLWLSVIINNVQYTSDPITYEVPWVDMNNNTPIIWLESELGTIVNYEEAVIKYMVYNSDAERQGSPVEVSLYHGTDLLNVEEVYYDSVSWHTMDLTPYYTVGNNTFTLVCGFTTKDIPFYVTTENARDLSLRYEDQLEINFDALGRSSKEIKSSRSSWVSKVTPKKTNNGVPYSATLSGFNWYSNGWKNDDDGNGSYLSFANGASATIPMSTISMNQSYSWTFEMRFRVRNAKRFATLVTNIPQYRYYKPEGGLAPLGEEKTIEEIAALYGIDVNDVYDPSILLYDEDGNPVMNEANTVKKIVRSNKDIAFKYLNANTIGFAIGTQEAYFNTNAGTVNVRYTENEIINIAFVFDKPADQLNIYLNGILSGSLSLGKVTSITMENIPFVITSDDCDFDLYKFRVYPLALSMPDIIHNYIADMKNISIYDENNLTDTYDDTKLSYEKLLEYNEQHPDNPTMPYAVIDLSDKTGEEAWLPYAKGNSKGAAITFVNPTADYLLETGQITPYQYYTHCPSFTSVGANIDVQGTSSQKYPRRNFKTKFKNAGETWVYTKGELEGTPISGGGTLSTGEKISKKWHMDSEKLGVNKFTWKIDYMESSGSYNTGFANLMGSGVYSKHPLEDLNLSGVDASIYRTSVYGFPLLVFYKGEDQKYVYIGRYNLNLDKSANERYGFELSNEQPYVTAQREVTDPETGEVTTETYHPSIADVSECWELRDNQGTYCSWRYPNAAARLAGFNARLDNDPNRVAVSSHFEPRYHKDADYIEYAQTLVAGETPDPKKVFPEQIGGNTPAIASNYVRNKLSNLEVLFNWLDSTDTTMADSSRQLPVPVTMKVNRELEENEALEQGVTYSKRTENDVEITYGRFTTDSMEYRLQKFYSEFDKHLDREYCAVYFVMTELLLCYDSRGKNMMMATFGPREANGDYIWYPIFYDIDTQLGLNNVGAKLWDYDEDCTENGTFSTKSSVLWTNMFYVFKDYIMSVYGQLRSSKITYDSIENSYLCRAGSTFNSYAMMGKRPIVAIGLDAYYKYVLPTKEDWINQEGQPARADYLYACQGDRILSREMLINNRLLYMDSKYSAGNFSYERGALSGINFRVSGNKPSTTSDKYIDAATLGLQVGDTWTSPSSGETLTAQNYPYKYFDAIPEYYVTPYLNFYPMVFIDKSKFSPTEAYNPDKYPNGIPVHLSQDITGGYLGGDIDQQLNYIAGSQYISSLGDLSTKYATEIHFPNASRLRDITLGSDIPRYYNSEKPSPLDLSASADPDGSIPASNKKPLLEKIILTGMSGISDGLDVRGATQLKEFRALNTQLPSVQFASGAPLTTIHLPSSTTELIFNENKDLTKILRSAPNILTYDPIANEVTAYNDPANYAGLYVAGLTDVVDDANNVGIGSNLQEISFSGDNMAYDSYEILRNVVHQKQGTGRSEGRLKIRMTDVVWSPYVQVEYGEDKKQNETYYYLTDHSTYEAYDHNDSEWLTDTLNGRVYTYDNSKDESIIQDLSLLQIFIDDMAAAEQISQNTEGHPVVINQFTNNIVSMDAQPTYPTLSGDMYISNAAGTAIDEATLTSTYAAIWPNLKIRAAKVDKAYISKFVQRLDSGKDTQLDIYRASRGDNVHPTMSSVSPTRANYVFRGWTLDTDYIVIDENDIASLQSQRKIYVTQSDFDTLSFSSSKDTYVFYAVFSITSYQITYLNPDGTEVFVDHKNYGTKIGYPLNDFPAFVHYEDNTLGETERYHWMGWVANVQDCFPINETVARNTVIDLTNKVASTQDQVFYACYIKIDATTRATQEGFFNFSKASIAYGDGYVLSPRVLMGGRITLPIEHEGKPVLELAGFSGSSVSHVFWNGESQVKNIQSECFMNCSSLVHFSPLEHLKDIQSFAFRGCTGLTTFYFAEGLEQILDNAFNMAFTGTINILSLPFSLYKIGGSAFAYCKWSNLVLLEIGNETQGNSVTDLGDNVFFQNNSNKITTLRVYRGNAAAFNAVCNNNVVNREYPGGA